MENRNRVRQQQLVVLHGMLMEIRIFLILFLRFFISYRRRRRMSRASSRNRSYSIRSKVPHQINHIRDIVGVSDDICRNNLRMPINSFKRLCFLLENLGGLSSTKHVSVYEQVAMFLSVLSHHKKNVTLQTDFKRSGHTVSVYFNRVLKAVLQIYPILVVTPDPIADGCTDSRWKYFKGCLGALDGTYISVRVPRADRARYRNRKGDISVNVLGVCDKNMNFIYILTGWEGSAADSRVLRDAVTRSAFSLKVPNGNYYLVDGGYTNGDGFLAPYRGVRYHLQEYGQGPLAPQNHKEYFNLKHAKARNVIERAFGILKSRWAILRSHAYYEIQQQNHIIMACVLLHNFIRTTTDVDPEEENIPEYVSDEHNGNIEADYIDHVQPSQEWTNWRDALAVSMYNEHIMHHH